MSTKRIVSLGQHQSMEKESGMIPAGCLIRQNKAIISPLRRIKLQQNTPLEQEDALERPCYEMLMVIVVASKRLLSIISRRVVIDVKLYASKCREGMIRVKHMRGSKARIVKII